MAEKESWFTLQTEDELMTEVRAKELRIKRCQARHAFKDELNRRSSEKDISMQEKFEIFRPYYEDLELTPAEKERIVFVQELQKAMNVHGTGEKKTDSRDIYTDTKTGVVGNIRKSENPYFVANIKTRFDNRAKAARERSKICAESLRRIQKDAPKQYELWEKTSDEE